MEDTRGNRRGVQYPVTNEEQILPTPLGHVAEGVEHDTLGVPVRPCLCLRQLRIEVIAAGLRHRREGVRCGTSPARHAYVHSIDERFVTEVSTPVVGDDERLDRNPNGIESHLLPGANHDRPKVAGAKIVRGHRVDDGLHQLIQRPLQGHSVDRARVLKSSHVLAKTKDRAAGRRFVTAHTFEHTRSVVNDVAHHVDGRVFPVHELAVTPDPGGLAGRAVGHCRNPVRVRLPWMITPDQISCRPDATAPPRACWSAWYLTAARPSAMSSSLIAQQRTANTDFADFTDSHRRTTARSVESVESAKSVFAVLIP